MRVYHVPDLDGLIEAIVGASRLEQAAAAFGITPRTMRERGWRAVKGAAAGCARKAPGAPLYRSIVGSAGAWTHDSGEARDRAARAIRRRTKA